MIKDVFYIKSWKVTILYECTCDDIDYIIETLKCQLNKKSRNNSTFFWISFSVVLLIYLF